MPITIRLEPKEFAVAVQAGVQRRLEAVAHCQQPYHAAEESFDPDILGAVGEAALARWLDVYWAPGRLGELDVVSCEVRSTNRGDGCLILHPSDDDDRAYVLALVRAQYRVVLVGWLYGSDGKDKKRYWRSDVRAPAFFVPQDQLLPMKGLKKIVWG